MVHHLAGRRFKLPEYKEIIMSQHVVTGDSCSDRTVMVGVKMDSKSRELLTWALVNVAQTGDGVIALHVLADHGRFVSK